MAALAPAHYLTGPYAAIHPLGQASDLAVVGWAGRGALGDVELIYVPEPSSLLLACIGFALAVAVVTKRR